MNYLTSACLFDIPAGHLNSQGSVGTGKYTTTKVKTIEIDGQEIPFVSPQAIRSYIREYIGKYCRQPTYYERLLRKTTKNDFVTLDPVVYLEDDFLGYSQPLYINPNLDGNAVRHKVASTNRRSPFLTTGLVAVENSSSISTSEGWVHPNQGTPLPYRAEFSTGFFQGLFCLEIDRIGIFSNYGDIIEMDPYLEKKHSEKLVKHEGTRMITHTIHERNQRINQAIDIYFGAIKNLYGGAKSTMFATPLHPNVMITILMDRSISLPSLFLSDPEIDINIARLKEFVSKWITYIQSDVIIGYRTGTFDHQKEEQLLSLEGIEIDDVSITITTPGKAQRHINEAML